MSFARLMMLASPLSAVSETVGSSKALRPLTAPESHVDANHSFWTLRLFGGMMRHGTTPRALSRIGWGSYTRTASGTSVYDAIDGRGRTLGFVA